MPEIKQKKILVVDDDVFLLSSITSFVTGAGYAVTTAAGGAEALARIMEGMPDLIIVDAIMPEMDGFELARRIRGLENGKKVPILMLSGLRTNAGTIGMEASGITEHITKPVRPEELLRRVEYHFRPRFF